MLLSLQMKQLGTMVIRCTTYFYIQKPIFLTKLVHVVAVLLKITTGIIPVNSTDQSLFCNVSRAIRSGFLILCISFMLHSADVAVPCQYDNYAVLWRTILSRGDICAPLTNQSAKLTPSMFQSHY
jgi:hypothetical protein